MNLCSLLAAGLTASMLGAAARPGVTYLYTYYDRNGNIVVNNLPPSSTKGMGLALKNVTMGRVRLAVSQSEIARVLRSPELLALVDGIATEEGVDPFLARAVIQAESAFYTKARSRAGALGLMQLMPETARRFGVLDPFDPRQNITGGVKYLHFLNDTFNGDLPKVVAAYNAGEAAVTKYNGVPPYPETRAYVPRVLELYNKRLVQPDPKAAGAMDLLKKGRGGFQVDGAAVRPTGNLVADASHSPAKPPVPIYHWVDAAGRTHISNDPPPKGARSRTFDPTSED